MIDTKQRRSVPGYYIASLYMYVRIFHQFLVLASSYLMVVGTGSLLSQPTPIDGVINRYASVTSVNAVMNRVTVDDASGFAVGDQVLIIQMQGIDVNSNISSSDHGSVTALNSSGLFEINVIRSIEDRVVEFYFVMQNQYYASGSVQIVYVPHYTSATVTSTLTPAQWNGRTGGVIAMTITDTLYLEDDIEASGAGFRGGQFSAYLDKAVGSGATNDSTLSASARGEGATLLAYLLGTSALANGGGGGSFPFYGGGGGANRGCGGTGGGRATIAPYSRSGGVGGHELDYQSRNNRIFMGGGGGAGSGRNNNTQAMSPGGNGGGIVLIDVPVIAGNSRAAIRTCGGSGGRNDLSGGGGGGGGCILVTARRIHNIPDLCVRGGDGGTPGLSTASCGSGGGGGGGAVFTGPMTAYNLNPSAYSGGLSGGHCADSTALNGCDGRVYANAEIPRPTKVFEPVSFRVCEDTAFCPGGTATLTATASHGSWTWTDQEGRSLCTDCPELQVSPDTTTEYTITLDVGDDYRYIRKVKITIHPVPAIELTGPSPFCPGDSAVISGPLGFARYLWSTGDTTASVVVHRQGTYTLRVWNEFGCDTQDSMHVFYKTTEVVAIEAVGLLSPIVAGHVGRGQVSLRNRSQDILTIQHIFLNVNTIFSIPPRSYFGKLRPGETIEIPIYYTALTPGEYRDTITVYVDCGVSYGEIHAAAMETPFYTRCRVRITSEGEIEAHLDRELLKTPMKVYDIQGRHIVTVRSGDYFPHRGLFIVAGAGDVPFSFVIYNM